MMGPEWRPSVAAAAAVRRRNKDEGKNWMGMKMADGRFQEAD